MIATVKTTENQKMKSYALSIGGAVSRHRRRQLEVIGLDRLEQQHPQPPRALTGGFDAASRPDASSFCPRRDRVRRNRRGGRTLLRSSSSVQKRPRKFDDDEGDGTAPPTCITRWATRTYFSPCGS